MKYFCLLLAICCCFLVGCTANQSAKNFGGTLKIDLEPGEKLIVCTWKDQELWYSTRKMRPEEHAEVTTFHEKSSYGIYEGTVIFTERDLK